jgi:2-methylisocitrate lyase-like PEP mutase family enzyme
MDYGTGREAYSLSPMRRFPSSGFKIVDANGQSLAYVYGHADLRDAQIAKALTLDEARRIASIAKLPELVGKRE